MTNLDKLIERANEKLDISHSLSIDDQVRLLAVVKRQRDGLGIILEDGSTKKGVPSNYSAITARTFIDDCERLAAGEGKENG